MRVNSESQGISSGSNADAIHNSSDIRARYGTESREESESNTGKNHNIIGENFLEKYIPHNVSIKIEETYKWLNEFGQIFLVSVKEIWEKFKTTPKPALALMTIIGLLSFYLISIIFGALYSPITDLFCNVTPYSGSVFSVCKLTIPNFTAFVEAQVEAQEQLLRRAAELDSEGSLAHDIKKVELATKDLITIVKLSELTSKHLLVEKLKGFVETSFEANDDLQTLQVRAQSSLDNTITYISYTLKTIEGFEGKIISPRQKRDLDKHHDFLVKLTDDDLRKLIFATDKTLKILKKLEIAQDTIRDIVKQEESFQSLSEAEMLSELWAILGGKVAEKKIYRDNLRLLKNLDSQRKIAAERIALIMGYLTKFQHQLGFLRDETVTRLFADIPLEIHLTNMKKALMRLQNNEITAGVKGNKAFDESKMYIH